MMYRIELSKRAKKDLEKIDGRWKIRVKAAFMALKMNPFLGKPLEGEYKGLHSYRVWPYRIVYKIIKSDIVILVFRVAHRQGVY